MKIDTTWRKEEGGGRRRKEGEGWGE